MRAYQTLQLTVSQARRFLWCAICGLALGLVCINVAYAATATVGGSSADFCFVDTNDCGSFLSVIAGGPFLQGVQAKSTSMMTSITNLVTNTFWILATIEFCWAAAMWAFEKDSMDGFASELIQKLMFICFYYFLLQNAPTLVPTVINSMKEAGLDASGVKSATVDGIVATGFATVKMIWENSPLTQTDADFEHGHWLVNACFVVWDVVGWAVKGVVALVKPILNAIVPGIGDIVELIIGSPCRALNILIHLPQIILAILVSIVVVIAFAISAFQVLAVTLEAYILLPGGAVFLGLGSSQWTNSFVNKYFSYMLTVGFRWMVILIVVGLTLNAINDTVVGSDFEFDFGPLFKLMIFSLLQMVLALRAPEMASAFMTGEGTGLSAGGVYQSIQSVKQSFKEVAKTVGKMAGPKGKAAVAAMEMGDKMKGAAKGAAGMGGGKGK